MQLICDDAFDKLYINAVPWYQTLCFKIIRDANWRLYTVPRVGSKTWQPKYTVDQQICINNARLLCHFITFEFVLPPVQNDNWQWILTKKKKSGESVPLQLSLHHDSLSFSILIKMLENPIYSSLTDTLFNISQLHNNMHVQINMNFTKKLDMDYKMSKNAFNMYYETTSFLPSFLHCSEYSRKKKECVCSSQKAIIFIWWRNLSNCFS